MGMTNRTRHTLRAKARLRRFDARMWSGHPPLSNSGCRRAVMRAWKHGLIVTSTTDGGHAPNSYHYQHRAVDFGLVGSEIGTARGARRLRKFQYSEFAYWQKPGKLTHLVELIGPVNVLIVLRGVRQPLAEGTALENMHDNHVHEAYV